MENKKSKLMRFPDMVKALLKVYNNIIVAKKKVYGYDGPLLTSSQLLATSFNLDKQLTKENLNYSRDEQGRSYIETIIGCAIQLGIQQGIYMCSDANDILTNIDCDNWTEEEWKRFDFWMKMKRLSKEEKQIDKLNKMFEKDKDVNT